MNRRNCALAVLLSATVATPAWAMCDVSQYPDLDDRIDCVLAELADSFGLKTTADDHPLVRDVGWRLHDTDKDIERFSSSRRKEVRFYLEQNPGYIDGAGLLYLASLDWSLVQEAATAKRPTLLGSQLKNAAEHSGHGQRMAA